MTLLVSGPNDPIPQVGTQLPNGAIVIEASSTLILACTQNAPTPYVTWKWDGKDLRTTWAGHYFRSLAEAVTSFTTR